MCALINSEKYTFIFQNAEKSLLLVVVVVVVVAVVVSSQHRRVRVHSQEATGSGPGEEGRI